MLEQRNLKLDVTALVLLAVTIFLAASLLSYHPGDPPSTLVYPPQTRTLNVCGHFGALASRIALGGLGVGAYYLVLSLAVLDAMLLARRPVGEPLLRVTGWLISLVGLTTLTAMAFPGLSPGPVIGAGGYLGAAGRGFLEMNFAKVGGYIFSVSMILGGLLLCTDYVLIRASSWLFRVPGRVLGIGAARAGRAYLHRLIGEPNASAKSRSRSEKAEDAEEADSTVAVRFPGRSAKSEEENATAAADQGAAAEPSPAASELRIRKPRKSERQRVIEQLEAASAQDEPVDYQLPGPDLLLESEDFCFDEHERDVRRKAKILEKTFANFGFNVRVVEIQTGPVIAQFEVELEAGLRLAKITGLADDLAIALRVPSVRIVAPIPGKNTVGIEVPNRQRQIVRIREVIEEAGPESQQMRVPVYLGKDVAGNPMVVDLSSMPHLLIAGRTGTGKSVCLNSIIVSMLMTRRPDEVRMLMIDPKMVELSPYQRIPHLMHPVVTDMRKAEAILGWAVEKMEERYTLLARAGVRHLSVYNQLGEAELMDRIQPANDEERAQIPVRMPYVVIVADEMADLMMTAAKEVEGHIIRLAQKSRAVGIHLVLATQKPTVDVITGLIKSNLPARIAFQVASRTDSRVVLDEMGADKLLGNGDMLFLWPGTSTLLRGQGTFVSDDEINRVVDFVGTTEPQYVTELVQLKVEEPEADAPQMRRRDDLYEAAVDIVVREGRGSVSLLQRALGIGYGRAARLIDYMAEDGVVGEYAGSQARDVLISIEQWEKLRTTHTPSQPPAVLPAPSPRRSNKIRPVSHEDDPSRWDDPPFDEEEDGQWEEEDIGDESDDGEAELNTDAESADGDEDDEEYDDEEEYEDEWEKDDEYEDEDDDASPEEYKAESA